MSDLPRLTYTVGETARILGHVNRRGQPRRDVIYALIRDGKLRLVDPTQPLTRWTVSIAELERYVEHGPRKEAS